jgi:hypothetical protein
MYDCDSWVAQALDSQLPLVALRFEPPAPSHLFHTEPVPTGSSEEVSCDQTPPDLMRSRAAFSAASTMNALVEMSNLFCVLAEISAARSNRAVCSAVERSVRVTYLTDLLRRVVMCVLWLQTYHRCQESMRIEG